MRRTSVMNMSYCRFENTSGDLADCVCALENGEDLSISERVYAKNMRQLCEEFIEAYDAYDWSTNEDDEES